MSFDIMASTASKKLAKNAFWGCFRRARELIFYVCESFCPSVLMRHFLRLEVTRGRSRSLEVVRGRGQIWHPDTRGCHLSIIYGGLRSLEEVFLPSISISDYCVQHIPLFKKWQKMKKSHVQKFLPAKNWNFQQNWLRKMQIWPFFGISLWNWMESLSLPSPLVYSYTTV